MSLLNKRKGNNDLMKKTRAVFAFLLILILCFSAHAESALVPFIDAAERLAYETDNVTITGKADFSLDGKWFKTAEINYIQDGNNSFWQEKLLTPREEQEDLESGFTVIQNDGVAYVMEALQPGRYREFGADIQNTILRRSPMTDLLLDMARTAANQLELYFGSVITIEERDDGSKKLRLELTEKSAPEILSHLANLGMRFIGNRLLGINGDELETIMGIELTDTKGILYYTKSLKLKDCSVSVSLDASGRMTAVSGNIYAQLTSYTLQELEAINEEVILPEWYELKDRILAIRFDASISEYEESDVKSFNSRDYRVTLPGDLPWDLQEQLEQRCRELCRMAGIVIGELEFSERFGDFLNMCFEADNREPCQTVMTKDGTLVYLQNTPYNTGGYEEAKDDLTDEQKQKTLNFMRAVNLPLEITDLKVIGQHEDNENRFIDACVIALDSQRQEPFDISLTIQVEPSWRIVFYKCSDKQTTVENEPVKE